MSKRLLGILGSALACCIIEVIFNLIAHGGVEMIERSAIAGLILGTIVGAGIAVFGYRTPIKAGVIITSALCAIIMLPLFFAFGITVISSPLEFVLVVASVLLLGAGNGFGYRLLGPKTE